MMVDVLFHRWHQRESHDFLDDCRRVVIGKIPINAINDGFDICSEPESPLPAPREVFPQVFTSNPSNSSDCVRRDEDSESGFLKALYTPPRPNTKVPPQKRNIVEEEWGPLVITNDDKCRRSMDAGSSRSLRTSLGYFFRRECDSNAFLHASSNRVLEYVTDSTVTQFNEQTEEAEEAIECLTPTEEHSPRRSTVRDQTDPLNEGLRIAQAAQTTALTMRCEYNSTVHDPEESVVRSRSASFLFDSPHVEDCEKPTLQDRDKIDGEIERASKHGLENVPNTENCESLRNRFSIGSFFAKLNRQRFVSECYPFISSSNTHHVCRTLRNMQYISRVSSCPEFLNENKAPAGLNFSYVPNTIPDDFKVRAKIAAETSQQNLLERFPYLNLVRPLGVEHYAKIEANIESDHEIRRTAYMEKSREFHHSLKEMGLADRLPGRIYDDMTHITDGLPMEKQGLVTFSLASRLKGHTCEKAILLGIYRHKCKQSLQPERS
ncbi:hypothetical protein NECAME_04686 [Necator americanus]|uniref:Uncharacterized protein n=1 Tax=Necator americanus TaxID=51031 RepID=W2SNK4_NECAM|nr:hypothetical protein NECAME_04686 [Necator americanus]ETN71123.1 hypothetical protein NECAME_04686 [Necator americanus]